MKRAKQTKRKAGKKGSPEQAAQAMKAVDQLEGIKAKLVHPADGGRGFMPAELKDQIMKSFSPNVGQGSGERQKLIVEVVHVDDNGNRIEPTEEQRELDRKIEGRHGKD